MIQDFRVCATSALVALSLGLAACNEGGVLDHDHISNNHATIEHHINHLHRRR